MFVAAWAVGGVEWGKARDVMSAIVLHARIAASLHQCISASVHKCISASVGRSRRRAAQLEADAVVIQLAASSWDDMALATAMKLDLRSGAMVRARLLRASKAGSW
jgi:hypothetical protein